MKIKNLLIVLFFGLLLNNITASEIEVAAGVNAISTAYASANPGDVIVLTTPYDPSNPSTGYIEEAQIDITKDITIKAAEGLSAKPVIFPVSSSKLFVIYAGLNLDGIVVDGNKPDGSPTGLYFLISMKVDTSLVKVTSSDFSVRINNCVFKNMTKDKAKTFYTSDKNKATLDSVIITNSVFKDISGYGIYLKTTKSYMQPGSFKYFKWENCLVENIGGSKGQIGVIQAAYVNDAEDVPEVLINHVTFANISQRELYITDCKAVVENSIVVNVAQDADSTRLIYNVIDTVSSGTLPETVVRNCLQHTNTPDYSFVATVLENNINADPMFADSANGDYTLAAGSPAKNAGTDGLDLGYYPDGLPTGVEKDIVSENVPTEFTLSQNYPNPFNPTTVINFRIPKMSNVELSVYNILGQKVSTLLKKELPAGSYKYSFDGSNLTSGIYFYKLSSKGFSAVKKMMLLK